MSNKKASEVFVPGGMPHHTYVARTGRKLEEKLAAAKDNLCKLVTVTGATKSGKTVLATKIFPRGKSIWVDGGAVREEDDFWNHILENIDGITEITYDETEESGTTISGKTGGAVGLPLFGQVAVEGEGSKSSVKKTGKLTARSIKPRTAVINQLRKDRIPLVIDDFHYMERELQGHIIRALKPLIFDGLPVILIAIPHRRYDAVKVEREMTGRLEAIQIPPWDVQELIQIPQEGFPLLNVKTDKKVCDRLSLEAYGSPHLMQEFCREVCRHNDISETQKKEASINDIPDDLFQIIADGTGKIIFDKLARGPRQRSDRLRRTLKNGQTTDIYNATLLALANLKPGLDTIDYEKLRTSIREVLKDNIPQAHEVSRVFEKMAEISSSDEASTPVLDWDKQERILHITDPFFAFYLRWGVMQRLSVSK